MSNSIRDGKFFHDEWCHWVIEGEACSCHVKTSKALLRVARAAKEFSDDDRWDFFDAFETPDTWPNLLDALKEVEGLL